MNDQGHVTAVLVHGTFARDASWVQEGSEFRGNLALACDSAIQFRSFRWSGKNSTRARLAAARDLADYLRNLPKRDGRVVLIGHSHGGNVALYSWADPSAQERIAGIVALATPFILPRYRDDPYVKPFIIAGATIIPLALSLSAAFGVTLVWGISDGPLARFIFSLSGVLALVCAIAAYVFFEEFEKHPFRTLDSDDLRPPMLVVRAPGDEASLALGISEFMTRTSLYLFSIPAALNPFVGEGGFVWPMAVAGVVGGVAGFGMSQASTELIVILSLCLGAIALTAWRGSQPFRAVVLSLGVGIVSSYLISDPLIERHWPAVDSLGEAATFAALFGELAVFVVFPCVLILASIVAWAVIIVSTGLAFGIGDAFAALRWELHGEVTPAGSWKVHMVSPFRHTTGLNHSVYDYDETVTAVAAWIEMTRTAREARAPHIR